MQRMTPRLWASSVMIIGCWALTSIRVAISMPWQISKTGSDRPANTAVVDTKISCERASSHTVCEIAYKSQVLSHMMLLQYRALEIQSRTTSP